MPLTAQTAPHPLAGIWLGTLATAGRNLRLQLRLQQDTAGRWTCLLDSLDQGTMGIPCTVTSAADPIAIDVPAVRGRFTANLTGDILDGLWSQGADLPLTFRRQAAPTRAPEPEFDAAIPPVAIDDLKSVLDRDLSAALASGALAPATNAGIVIGVVQRGLRRIITYGIANPDSVFEIGSVTKTFTATILAQMVKQHTVCLDEPVRELLPPGTVLKPASGAEITLVDLSDQHSGLPRLPGNFHPADPANPYADYDAKLLYAYIAKQGVALPSNAPFNYSNLGVGLLGHALANRANLPYPQLLYEQVTGLLGMSDTTVALTPSMQSRLIQGYDVRYRPARTWDFDALAGAGAMRSTVSDMLIYLEAQLHPDKLPQATLGALNGRTLPRAIALTHTVQAEAGPGLHIALSWLRVDDTGSYWHNGGTGGCSSYALFNPELDFAVIVLSNSSPGPRSITDKLGQHIAQRLTGRPAVSLAP